MKLFSKSLSSHILPLRAESLDGEGIRADDHERLVREYRKGLDEILGADPASTRDALLTAD